jgi:dihydroorotase
MNTLLRAITIIDPRSEFHQKTKDVLINEHEILSIEDALPSTEHTRIVNAKNLVLCPSFFDSQVSFGEPGYEERESLTRGLETAQASGFGALAMLPNTFPVVDNASMVNFIKNKVAHHPVVLYPLGCITKDMKGEHMAELYDMHNAGAIAFADDTHSIEDANLIKIALQYVQSFGGILFSFPKNTQIARNAQVNESIATTKLGMKSAPSIAESLQIARDLHVLAYTGGKLHIPLITTEASVNLIKEAKNKGLNVSCSVAVHHLYFTDEKLSEFDTRYKVEPPLRNESDRLALIEGLKDGTIDMITTDHRPREIEAKQVEFEHASYGTIGLESCFGACNKILGIELSIEKLAQSRSLFGLEIPKIGVGEKLNFNVLDPSIEYTFSTQDIRSSSSNSIFLDEVLKGKVVETFITK